MKHLLLALIVATAPLAAHAGKEEEAIKSFERGEKLYAEEKYEDALKAFRKAYSLQPIPALFINIGQCFRKMEQHELAIQAFERYLTDDPEGDQRAAVEELIASEKAILNPPPPPPPEPEPVAAPPPPPPPTPAPAATPVEPAPADDGGGLFAQPVFWAAVGGAALVAIAGGTVAAIVVASPPAPEPTGSLGTFDLR